MKKLPKTPQIGIPSSASRAPYFTVKKKTPRSSSRNFSKKTIGFSSNATQQAQQETSKIQIILRVSLQRFFQSFLQGIDCELSEASLISKHQASNYGIQLFSVKDRRQALANIDLRGNASVTNFSNKYEISSLFTSRKAPSKSGSGNHSGRNTSLGTSHDRVINLVSKQDMQNHLEINTSLNANMQPIFRNNSKKAAKRGDPQQKSQPKFSKNALYLNPLLQQNNREFEPMTPTFEDPLLIPFGNSTPSSPHQHAGVVKLITSLQSTRRITKSQNFATEPRKVAGTSTQHQFSPTSTEIGDQRLSRNDTENRSTSNCYEKSMDTIVQDQEISNHFQPILEQQQLIAGDNALSAIQSNESFDIERKEAKLPSKFKNYLSNNNRSSAQLESQKREMDDKGCQSAKQIISVTVTPALSNLSAEHRRKSLKMMASPSKKSTGNKIPLKMKSADRKCKLKSGGPSLAPRNKSKVQQKSMQDISPNSDITSPLDYKVQDCDQKFYMNNSMERGHSAALSINQDIRELSLTLQGIARKSQQDLKQAVDQSLNRDGRAEQRKDRYLSNSSGFANVKNKQRLNSQYYQQWVNDGGATTMDTTDQISGLSLKKGQRETKRKSPTMPGTQFEILATKLKKQILGGQTNTGTLLAKNPNSLPTTPRHCIDNNSQIYKNQLHNSPDSIRSQMLRDAMHKMPVTARPRYASSSLSYYKFPQFVKKQPFFRQVVHLNNEPKEGNTASGQSTPKLYNNNSQSEGKIIPLKSSFLDTRCPSTTLLLQEDEKTKSTSVASLSPIGKRRSKKTQGMMFRGADGLHLIKKRMVTMLGWYSQKVQRMQNEINELKSENTTLKNLYCRGSSTLSPPPLSSHTQEEVLQYSVEMYGPRIQGAMTPQPTSTTQPLLYFKAQAPTPPDRRTHMETPMEAWNSSLEASNF